MSLAGVCLALANLACARPIAVTPTMEINTVPADFSLRYEWTEGSLPPPYHYEYTLRLEASGQGEVDLIPDYPGPDVPVWVETFRVAPADLLALYRELAARGLFSRAWRAISDIPVGGAYDSLSATANGQSVQLPAFVIESQAGEAAAILGAVRAQLPPANWDKLNLQLEQYRAEHSR